MFKKIRSWQPTMFEILLGLVALSIVIGIFFLLFRTKKELTITVKVNEDNVVWPNQGVSTWFAQLFYEGMAEKTSFGKSVAKVIKVKSYYTEPSRKAVYLTLRLETIYSRGANQYVFKGKNVLIGSTIQLLLDKVYVEGLITDIKGFKKPYPKVRLMVEVQVADVNSAFPETLGIPPFIADNIYEGDVVKDSQEGVVLRVLKKTVEDADKTVVTDSGEVLLRKDPLRKDVYLTLEVVADKINGRYYFFDDVPVVVGLGLPIHLDKISIWPAITRVTEKK